MAWDGLKKVLKTIVGGSADSQSAPLSAAKAVFPRAPRVNLSPELRVWLNWNHPEAGAKGHECHVTNVSVTGVAFDDGGQSFSASIGKTITGQLHLDGNSMPVSLMVVHHTGARVGARWVALEPSVQKALWEWLKPEKAAAECNRMPEQMLRAELDGSPCCYQSNAGNEFFLVSSEGKLVRYTLSLFGVSMEYSGVAAARFVGAGRQIGETRRGSTTYQEVEMKLSDAERALHCEQIARFLKALPGLDADILSQVVSTLR
jgi:hypothetical protein